MPARRTRALAVLTTLSIYALLLVPVHAGQWFAMREFYRLCMRVGLIEDRGAFWGQIHGLNIPTHPEALRLLVRLASLGVTLAPLIGVCLLVWYQLGRAPVLGVRRWITLRRAAVCALGAVLAIVLSERPIERFTQRFVYRAGEAAGCEFFISSTPWLGPDGPFMNGRWVRFFNTLYTHGPWVTTHTLALLLAWGALAIWSRRDPRPRLGQCAACGYQLAGLSPCPECGQELS